MNGYEWDSKKAAQNLKKHGVDFADAAISLHFPTLIPTPATRNDTSAWVPILKGGYSSRYTRTEATMSALQGVQGCTTTRKPRLRSETLLRARGLDKVWFAAGKIRGIIEGAAS